jgi:hypothetical protein
MKKLSELLKKMLDSVNFITTNKGGGLCYLNKLVNNSPEDYKRIYNYLRENEPKFTWHKFRNKSSSYWWKRGKVTPRKRWLKKHIKLLEKKQL